MKHFKRFRKWLTTLYSDWAMPQQLGIHDSRTVERAAEAAPKQQITEESVPVVTAQPSGDPASVRSSGTPAERQNVHAPVQSTAVTSIPKTTLKEPTITDPVWVTPAVEPETPVLEAKRDSTAATKELSDQPVSPVSSSDDQPFRVASGEQQTPRPVSTNLSAKREDTLFTDEKHSPRINQLQEAAPTRDVVMKPGQRVADQKPAIPKPDPLQQPPAQVSEEHDTVSENGSGTPVAQPKTAVTVPSFKKPTKTTTPTTQVSAVPRKAGPGERVGAGKPEGRLPQKSSAVKKRQGVEAVSTDAIRSTPNLPPKKSATRPKQVTPVHEPAPTQPSAPNTQVPQAVSSSVNTHAENGTRSGILLRRGKYDPGMINDQTAQRLARLLVSEIKLYNMNKIAATGEVNNIYDLLKDPIDKSRHHYQQRLGKTAIEGMPDYFHVELVRSLCEGDPSRLGPNYQTGNE